VVDGEIVLIRRDSTPTPRLDFELLQQRIHPAASRVKMLAEKTPCDFVAFDVLALDDSDLRDEPYERRRLALESALADVIPPVHVTPTTQDVETAREWFSIFEGAGLDGLIAKPADIRYVPNKRLMYKIKHSVRRIVSWPASGTTRRARWWVRCCSGSSTTRGGCTTSG
jgi:ATP-dependent DNA ligase